MFLKSVAGRPYPLNSRIWHILLFSNPTVHQDLDILPGVIAKILNALLLLIFFGF